MFDTLPASHPQQNCGARAIALQQSPPWLAAMRLLGTGARMEDVGAERRALTLRHTPPLIGQMALVSRADLGLTASLAAGMRSRLAVGHLVVNAETPLDASALREAGFHRIAADRQVAELALSPSTDDMAARLHSKWRNRLRKGQQNGLVLRRRPFPPDLRHWLFQAEAEQARRLRYQPLPPKVVAAVAACTPGSAQIFTAYHLGQRVAAMLFLRHGTEATYQIGWSNAEGRRLNAGPALMWRAMVELQAMGTTRIDLGAADPARAPGLTHFKLGTGAQIRPLGGTWLDTVWAGRRHRRWIEGGKRALHLWSCLPRSLRS